MLNDFWGNIQWIENIVLGVLVNNVLCDYLNWFIFVYLDVYLDDIVISSKNLHRIQQDIVSEREP